jgi:hypothetical protein
VPLLTDRIFNDAAPVFESSTVLLRLPASRRIRFCSVKVTEFALEQVFETLDLNEKVRLRTL